uniref:Ig-like domain-containing protein n=1 Tax=Stegastes partitus TaxID=144197 RepID=A0A3B4ZAQ6_9TELE
MQLSLLQVCVVQLPFIRWQCSSLSDRVFQTPDHISKEPGEEAKMNCSHTIQGYDRILWYKQTRNSPPQFLGHVYVTVVNPEPGLDVQMEGSASEGQTCTLTVKDLSPNSSAVYFCAVRLHDATYHLSSVQKPPYLCFPKRCCLNTKHFLSCNLVIFFLHQFVPVLHQFMMKISLFRDYSTSLILMLALLLQHVHISATILLKTSMFM